MEEPLVIVAAALFDERGRVLAGQRAHPPALSGRWEFPGGKVEPGESEPVALVRECAEELGVTVRVGVFLAEAPLPGGRRLRLWRASLTSGQPQAREHLQLRWLGAHELDELDWLAPNLPLLERVRPLVSP